MKVSRTLRIRHLNVAPIPGSCSLCVDWRRWHVERSLPKLILLVTSLKVASANVGKLSLNIPQILRFRVSTEPEFLCAWYSHCFPSVGPYSDDLIINFLDECVGRVQKFLCDFCYCGFQWGKMWNWRIYVAFLSYKINNTDIWSIKQLRQPMMNLV